MASNIIIIVLDNKFVNHKQEDHLEKLSRIVDDEFEERSICLESYHAEVAYWNSVAMSIANRF